MKIALDPLLHADLSIPDIPRVASELGFEYLEMCSRDEFIPEYLPPRASRQAIRDFKQALRDANVKLFPCSSRFAGQARTKTSVRRRFATGNGRSRLPSS